MESNHKSARWILSACTISAYSCLTGEDLLMEIFKRLPIVLLCRLRCVCTKWNSLISSSFFVNLHHSIPSTTPAHLKPYLRVNLFDDCHDCYAVYRPVESNDVEHVRHDVYFPFRYQDDAYLHSLNFVGLVNGVVCISYSLDSSFDSTILWNPAIRKYVPLPWLPFQIDAETAKGNFPTIEADAFVHNARFFCNIIGLGYDTCKRDFKVVHIWIPDTNMAGRCKSLPPTCEVYSNKGLWRMVPITGISLKNWEFGIDHRRHRTGCFVNGTIHWLLTTGKQDRRCVLMFNCESEEFTTTELPQEVYLKEDGMWLKNTMILEYGGMLALVAQSRCGPQGFDWATEMWVMEEHGVTATWKKLYRAFDSYESDNIIVDTYRPSFEKLAPYGPNRWIKFDTIGERECQVLRDHVYEESLFLLDDHKARSYTKEEIVPIFVPIEFKKHSSKSYTRPMRKARSVI